MSPSKNVLSTEQEALSAYVILARDWCDYMDYVQEMSTDGKALLRKMLSRPNPKHDAVTIELNRLGLNIIGE